MKQSFPLAKSFAINVRARKQPLFEPLGHLNLPPSSFKFYVVLVRESLYLINYGQILVINIREIFILN